jgi:DNA modification methylase
MSETAATHSSRRILERLARDFNEDLNLPNWAIPHSLMVASASFLSVFPEQLLSRSERRESLRALVSRKLQLSRPRLQELLDRAAKDRIFFNYHEKAVISDHLDRGDVAAFRALLLENNWPLSFEQAFQPVPITAVFNALHKQLEGGMVNRSDARELSLHEKRQLVLSSLFGGYIFSSLPVEYAHRTLDGSTSEYHASYYAFLQHSLPSVLNRDRALSVLQINTVDWSTHPYDHIRNIVARWLDENRNHLSNHCKLSVIIEPGLENGESCQWRLFSDLTLYAEKGFGRALTAGYFRHSEIQDATRRHIPHLNVQACRFELAEEGITFHDCFVINLKSNVGCPDLGPSLLLTFEVNRKDETPIPCPACRATLLKGNSYPIPGVKSWECDNPICPERSLFNRGNRFSLSTIIRQEAIREKKNEVPEDVIKAWRLDVVEVPSYESVYDMLLFHYTLVDDRTLFTNTQRPSGISHRRQVECQPLPAVDTTSTSFEQFEDGYFFNRYLIDRVDVTRQVKAWETKKQGVTLLQGDCYDALQSFPDCYFDGAVTSPPYYNARDYSTWPNIYAYLYDMYNVGAEVYRTLKSGSYLLYNIFDYFDNENSLAMSAMGKKRMILGAYIIHAFRHAGFELQGNVIWFKGEVEGKRNHNQGNRSPYYQLPLNSWEHILIFRKPGEVKKIEFPFLQRFRPVMKMVRGVNTLGHSAPFPAEIPYLLIRHLEKPSTILDPYSGSMTTARVAYPLGINTVSIEQSPEYCDLGLELLRAQCQPSQQEFDI